MGLIDSGPTSRIVAMPLWRSRGLLQFRNTRTMNEPLGRCGAQLDGQVAPVIFHLGLEWNLNFSKIEPKVLA